jgi:hypothetical protein
LEETSAGRQVDPAILIPRKKASPLAPILVAVTALLVLGGGVAAWVVMGKRKAAEDATATSATASASAAPEPPAASESAAPAAPADSASAAPADSAAPSADADAGAAGTDSTIACDPECDEIRVDDKVIELGKPVQIPPGKHVIVATKNGYATVREQVLVKAGEKLERTFKLKAAVAAGASPAPAPAGPAKPCGKFLKRGAGCK